MAEVSYYFNGHSASDWNDPDNFDDGNIGTFANDKTNGHLHTFNSNNCPGTNLGIILKVELRVFAYGDGDDQIDLTPVFAGGDGDGHDTVPVVFPGGWTAYVDITNDTNHPDWSSWSQVQALGCKTEFDKQAKANTMYGAKVEIRVIYWAPPVADIDIGAIPIDRAENAISGWTFVAKDNPANGSGTLHSVKVYAATNMTGLRVGTFYTTNGNTFKCRDSVLIGDVEAGAERTFTGLSIDVQVGDYIGCYFDTGALELDSSGGEGAWLVLAEYIDPNDETTYTFYSGYVGSLYGYGDFAVAIPRHGFVNFQDPGIV